MKKITVPLPEEKKVEINGHVFTIYADDVDILSAALELEKKYTDYKTTDSRKIIAGIKEIIDFINSSLGDKNAMKIIAGGRSVNMMYAITTMKTIVEEVVKAYQKNVAEEYE